MRPVRIALEKVGWLAFLPTRYSLDVPLRRPRRWCGNQGILRVIPDREAIAAERMPDACRTPVNHVVGYGPLVIELEDTDCDDVPAKAARSEAGAMLTGRVLIADDDPLNRKPPNPENSTQTPACYTGLMSVTHGSHHHGTHHHAAASVPF